jgi:hypothetical protein
MTTSRPAGGLGFRSALGAFAQNRAALLGGALLAGVPLAMTAVEQLGREPGNTAVNMSGTGGALAGGGAGAALGGLVGMRGGRWGMLAGAGLGGLAGGWAGGELGRGIGAGVQGITRGDATAQMIRQNERLARSQIGMQNEAALASIPVQEAMMALQQQQEQIATDRAIRAQRQMLYQQTMLGPSGVAPGAYMDPAFTQSLAALAAGGPA